MKFAALGRTQLLYDSVVACVDHGHELVLVGTCPAAPEYTKTESDFEELANKFSCFFFCDPKINKPVYLELMRKSGAEVAISVNWLTIIGKEVLDLFTYGVINAHAGDLPRFRGNACPNWAILTGEDKIVITLHQMVEELDAGPILLQSEFPLTARTYIGDVYKFLEEEVPQLFAQVLNGFALKTIEPRKQPKDMALSLRCFPRMPQDGYIQWDQPAEAIARLVRASSEPFAGAFTYLGEEKLVVWRAHEEHLPYPYLGVPGQVVEIRRSSGEVLILAKDGAVALEELETTPHGRVPAADIIRSTKIRLGIDWISLFERVTESNRDPK